MPETIGATAANSSAGQRAIFKPARLRSYGLFVLIMGIYTLPILGVQVKPFPFLANWSGGQITLTVIHELSGFLFFGHTIFSNIWAMRVRAIVDEETGLRVQRMLRQMAFGITLPTTIITPLAGVMLVDGYFGGFSAVPWAFEAYIAFWVMAAQQLVPDIVNYTVAEKASDTYRYRMQAAIRGIISTILTFYIIWCMSSKVALFAG